MVTFSIRKIKKKPQLWTRRINAIVNEMSRIYRFEFFADEDVSPKPSESMTNKNTHNENTQKTKTSAPHDDNIIICIITIIINTVVGIPWTYNSRARKYVNTRRTFVSKIKSDLRKTMEKTPEENENRGIHVTNNDSRTTSCD